MTTTTQVLGMPIADERLIALDPERRERLDEVRQRLRTTETIVELFDLLQREHASAR